MFYYLLITAITVSIDSLFCGLSLRMNKIKKLTLVLGIALTVFIMCTIANYLALFLFDYLNEKTASFGGVLLILVGLYNLFKKDDGKEKPLSNSIKQTLVIGFSVGLDGALANLSLALMGINAFYVPITIALTHALMIWIGILIANTRIIKKFAKIEFIAPFRLILLGAYNLLGLFI